MFYSNLSIGRKLALVMGTAFIISIFVSMLVTNSMIRSSTSKRISDSEIPAILASVANDVELQISLPLNAAKSMANNDFIIRWVDEGEPQSNLNQVASYLERVKKTTGAMFSFIVSSETGKYYSPEGISRTVSDKNPDDSWLYGFLGSQKPFSLDLDTDVSNDIYTLFINYRLASGDVVAGLGLSVSTLSNFIQQYKVGEKGHVYLVDGEGQIRIHANSDLAGKKSLNDLQHTAPIASQLLNKNQVNIFGVSEGSDTIVASRYIDSLGWYLVAELPADEVFGDLKDTTNYVILVNVIIAIFVLLLIVVMANRMAKPIKLTADMLDAIAQGDADLTKRLREDRGDELGKLARAFNRFMDNMTALVKRVDQTSLSLEQVANTVSQSAQATQKNSSEQLQSVEMVATAINEMGATVKEIAQNAVQTADASSDSASSANESQRVVESTVGEIQSLNQELANGAEVIEALAEDINKISSTLSVITGISEQTNLLALNAAIEAARAGEQGRGFAVVADEVRMLAGKTQESTEQINEMIAKLESGAMNAVSAMSEGKSRCESVVESASQTNASLENIRLAIQRISDMSFLVATATEEQSTVVEDLNQHITLIYDLANKTNEASDENASACQAMEADSQNLSEIVSNFKY